MFHLTEPQRGTDLLLNLYGRMNQSPTRQTLFPILADIFVFSYPLYLGGIYLRGKFKKQITHKIAALQIFVSVALSVLVNIGIQTFFDKNRPNFVLGFTDEKTESILHKFLPKSSFPSDHAAVTMSIAVASLIRGLQHKKKFYIISGIILIAFSLITSFSRVTISIHRPTDIIGGSIVGILIPLLISNKKISSLLMRPFGWIMKMV